MTKRSLRDGMLGLLLVALCLGQCGCLLALAGAGAGAGAAYVYSKGQSKGCFAADFATTWHTARAALGALGLPIVDERYAGVQGTIEARSGDGRRVVIKLRSAAAPIPNDGFRTEVSVRVGTFGDEAVSDRILTEIGCRLAPPGRDVNVPTAARHLPAVPPQGQAVEQLPVTPAPVRPPPPDNPMLPPP